MNLTFFDRNRFWRLLLFFSLSGTIALHRDSGGRVLFEIKSLERTFATRNKPKYWNLKISEYRNVVHSVSRKSAQKRPEYK